MSSGSNIKAESAGYLWSRRIVTGSITVIFSRPGRGKSTLASDMTAHVTTGNPWPDGSPCPKGTVIYIKGEGSDAALRDRMDLAGADPARYFVISRTDDPNAAMIDLSLDTPLLADVLRPDTRLIVVDTLDSLYTSMRMIDNANIRKCIWPMQELAEQRGIAMVFLAHTNKGGYADPIDRLSGGRAIGAAARAVWYLGKLTPDADLCHLAVVKANDFQPASTLAYRIAGVDGDRPGYIDWQGESEVSAWDLDGPPKPADRADKAEACEKWLADLLADGPMPVREVEKLADAQDYGRKVMSKAKGALDTRTIAQKGAFPTAFWLCLLGQCPPPLSMTPKGVIFDSESITNITPSRVHVGGVGVGVRD